MAKNHISTYEKKNTKRKGVHAKSDSSLKTSKNYKKKYRGQGR